MPPTWGRFGHEVEGEHVGHFHGEELQHHARQVTPVQSQGRALFTPRPPAGESEPPPRRVSEDGSAGEPRASREGGVGRRQGRGHPGPTFGSLARSSSQTSQTHPLCRAGNRRRCPLCPRVRCAATPASLTPAAQLTPPGHCLEGEWPT